MKVFSVSSNQKNNLQQNHSFSGYKIITNNDYSYPFQVLKNLSRNTLERMGKKYDVKLFLKDNPLISYNGQYMGVLNSFVKIEIRDLYPAKNKAAKFFHDIFHRPFKAQKVITKDMYLNNDDSFNSNNQNSINKWLIKQESKFLEIKKSKQ